MNSRHPASLRTGGSVVRTVHFDPLVPPHRDQPELAYKQLLNAGVSWCPDLNMYVVARHHDVVQVLHDPTTFSAAAPPMWETNPPDVVDALPKVFPLTSMLIGGDGPRHAAVRAIFLRAATAQRGGVHAQLLRRWGDNLVDAVVATRPGGGQVNLRAFAHQLAGSSANTVFGFAAQDVMRVEAWTAALASLWDPTVSAEDKLESVEWLETYRPRMEDLIARRRADPFRHDDLINDLINGSVHERFAMETSDRTDRLTDDGLTDDRLTDEEIIALVLGARVAASDTTRDTITSTVRLMLETGWWVRAVHAGARERGRILDRCRDEALRRFTPHRSFSRVTTRETQIGDTVLPAGALLLVSTGAANVDPTVFDDPLMIDIERANLDKHLAFGSGSHACGGGNLALTEITVALDVLLTRIPDLRLVDTGLRVYRPSVHFYGLDRLDVQVPRPARRPIPLTRLRREA